MCANGEQQALLDRQAMGHGRRGVAERDMASVGWPSSTCLCVQGVLAAPLLLGVLPSPHPTLRLSDTASLRVDGMGFVLTFAVRVVVN